MSLKASVIISTYNQPKWLYNVLIGYEKQTETNFEVIIADDGSSEETQKLIQQFKQQSHLSIQYLWQEDDGFQKNKILNKAIVKANAEYLIFTDGDCIPRKDFVEKHIQLRKKGSFLSGGYFKLITTISEAITKQVIESQLCFNKDWLLSKGQPKSFKLNKLTAFGLKEKMLNKFTPTKATYDGMNVSGWKADVLKVNGYDERMKYGGEDRELGERLINMGIKPIQARYSLICVHLHHDRSYISENDLKQNLSIRKSTKQNNSIWTSFGIKKD